MHRLKLSQLNIIFLIFSFISYSQENFTLNGYVLDENDNESIIGANIMIPNIDAGTITNTYGFFSITIPKGNYEVQISSLGYKNITTKIDLIKNVNTTFFLSENVENLEEVILVEDIEEIDITKPIMSLSVLSYQTIKQTPVLFGESDVLKTIQLLPGVSNAGEGTGGFNVRGGAADQNLIYLMKPLYTVHLTYLVYFLFLILMQLKRLSSLKEVYLPPMVEDFLQY
jgi:hypothetical protein